MSFVTGTPQLAISLTPAQGSDRGNHDLFLVFVVPAAGFIDRVFIEKNPGELRERRA